MEEASGRLGCKDVMGGIIGFLRVGEFISLTGNSFDKDVNLSLKDVSIDNPADPRMLFIRLKRSKTDQLRLGATIIMGKSDKVPLCPPTAMLGYLVVRGRSEGPLFVWENGLFLTRANVVAAVKRASRQLAWMHRISMASAFGLKQRQQQLLGVWKII